MMSITHGFRAAMFAGLLVGTPAALQAAPLGTSSLERSPEAVTSHVVVISIDGLRPDAIERFGAPTLQRLMREGAYSLRARTTMPSRTLPSHTSMLTGVGPETHGVTWNEDETDTRGTVGVPTVFARARDAGLTTAAFFSKSKFQHLQVPNSLDGTAAPDGDEKWSAARTAANVREYLSGARPNLLFVHFGEPDYAGHRSRWMSGSYGRAVRSADAAVASVLQDADRAFGAGNYTVIVTADHGGSGWTHGSASASDTTIPWISWGRGVAQGEVLADGIRTMDTAATALQLLGVTRDSMTGVPVSVSFSSTLP